LQLLHAEQNPHDEFFNATLQLLQQQQQLNIIVVIISLCASEFFNLN
jgi:hypothetical protein